MSFSMYREKCDRCKSPTGGSTIMSMFNEDVICMLCSSAERQRPDYVLAIKAEHDAIKLGNFNFPGIGFEPKISQSRYHELQKLWRKIVNTKGRIHKEERYLKKLMRWDKNGSHNTTITKQVDSINLLKSHLKRMLAGKTYEEWKEMMDKLGNIINNKRKHSNEFFNN